jgi:hypothetical protein
VGTELTQGLGRLFLHVTTLDVVPANMLLLKEWEQILEIEGSALRLGWLDTPLHEVPGDGILELTFQAHGGTALQEFGCVDLLWHLLLIVYSTKPLEYVCVF